MIRVIVFATIFLCGLLQYKLWVGDGSLEEVHKLNVDIAELNEQKQQLQLRNNEIAKKLSILKDNPFAIEEHARMELGLIKPGEVYYQIVEPID